MTIALNPDQSEILREILEASLHQLRVESARADSSAFRDGLHRRERVVESMLSQLRVDASG